METTIHLNTGEHTDMSQDAEHISWLLSKWQEIAGIAIAVLGILGISIRRKKQGKNLVTQEFLDNRLELFSERLKNDMHYLLDSRAKDNKADIQRVEGRLNAHIDSCTK